jgi:hypothetical protein
VLFVDDILDKRIGIGLECVGIFVFENRFGENLGITDVFNDRSPWRTGALWAVCFATLATTQPPHLPIIEKLVRVSDLGTWNPPEDRGRLLVAEYRKDGT